LPRPRSRQRGAGSAPCSATGDGRFKVQVVTRDGRYLHLGEAVLGGAKGTWGGQLPVDLSAVDELRFVGSEGRPWD